MWPIDISTIDFGRILKWVVIVLITGFIAQFGKSFATYVMKKIRAGKIPEKPEQDAENKQEPQWPTLPPGLDSRAKGERKAVKDVADPEEKIQAKLQKKEAKAQIKTQKKEEKMKDKEKT